MLLLGWSRPLVLAQRRWRSLATTAAEAGELRTRALLEHPRNNVPPHVAERLGRDLHLQQHHPLCTIRTLIEKHWRSAHPEAGFHCVSDLAPLVTVKQNFDELLIPPGHVSRRPSDTYYVDDTHVLRTHTSAHQQDLIASGLDAFLVTGDVYRRDEIDRTHYPVFHQMEGVRVYPAGVPEEVVVADLKRGLEGMARALFGDVQMRWVEAYFPFTEPSLELEVYYGDDWLEVLGCGVIRPEILADAGRGPDVSGWAFGLGLERLAMVLFGIPDIRLFWSTDPRFMKQFVGGGIVAFKPYSKYPACFKDVSFWFPDGAVLLRTDEDAPDGSNTSGNTTVDVAAAAAGGRLVFHPNDLFEVVRDVAGDLVEQVELIDDFVHPKTGRASQCYRVTYRDMDRNLTNAEVDEIQLRVRGHIAERFGIELR